MDCGNYLIDWILKDKGISLDYDQETIFSEEYPDISLLPKIGKILLKVFPNVLIVHENAELFVNVNTDEEEEIVNEYREELYSFMSKGGKFGVNTVSLELLNEIIPNYFYGIIPINIENIFDHLVILRKDTNGRKVIDYEKGEYVVSDDKLLNTINIKNGKHVLFCGEYVNVPLQ